MLTLIDSFKKEQAPVNLPFRMPVQDVYKFTSMGDSRRIIAGSITAGTLRKDDELVFYPSGKKSRVAEIENFTGKNPETAECGSATGFTMTEQIYTKRGDLAAKVGERQPQVGNVLKVSLFWLGSDPLTMDREYLLKLGTDRVPLRLLDTIRVIDASSLPWRQHEKDGWNATMWPNASCPPNVLWPLTL